MATLIVPVSGPYVGLWNGLVMGTQDDDGWNLSCTVQGQEVNRSDAYGETLIEIIYRGQNWRVAFRGLEWAKAGMLSAHQMFGYTTSSLATAATNLNPTLSPFAATPIVNVGDAAAASAYAKVLLLTAILPNTICIPTTLSASFAALSANFQASYNLTSKLRELPLEFSLIPYTTTISAKTFVVPFTSS